MEILQGEEKKRREGTEGDQSDLKGDEYIRKERQNSQVPFFFYK